MLDLEDLRRQIYYDKDTGDCYRIGYYDCHGNFVKCNYKIQGRTRPDRYGYYRVSIGGKRYVVHKLVYYYVTGEWPDTIDHIDGDCSNNKFVNLRSVTRQQNMMNLKLRTDNPTGYIGVAMKYGKYYAHCQKEGKRLFAGYFDTIEEAVEARKRMSLIQGFHENHGERL